MKKFNNLKSAFWCVLLVFSFVSCQKEQVKSLVVDGSPSSPQSSEFAYVKLGLYAPNDIVLRNASATTVDPMQKISSILLLFYGQKDNTLKTIKEIKNVTNQEQLKNIVVKIVPDNYKLVVVANPSERIRTLVNPDALLSNIEQGQTILSQDLFNDTDKSIVMSNAQGAVNLERTDFQVNPSNMSKTHTISLEPTLARVVVYGTPELRFGSKGKAPVKFVVNNLPKQVSLLRQMNLLSTGLQEALGDQSSRESRYAKSPFWDVWASATPQSVDDIASYTVELLCAKEMGNTARENLSDYQDKLENKNLYVKESTMPQTCFLKALAPYVHIAYPYIPKGLTINNEEGWLSYQGTYYTESEAREALKQKLSTNKLYQLLQERNISSEYFEKPEGFSLNGLNFYYKGYSYYTVFIKHFGREQEPYGRYGLVRGNEYRIRLVSINAPGSPTPITYNNDFSPIVEQGNAGVNISIQPVETREQNEEI